MEVLDTKIYSNFATYLRKRNTNILILFLIFIIDIFFLMYYLNVGEFNINFLELIRGNNNLEKHIFYNIRLKNALACLVVGGGLGFCGALMQVILKNPMASPYTLGVSQGAAFGATFAIIFLNYGISTSHGEGVFLKNNMVVVFAFLGSLMSIGLIFVFSFLRSFSRHSLILAGISVGAFFQAATMFIQYFADEVKVAATLFWTFGDVSKSNWFMISSGLIIIVIGFLYFLANGWKMNMFYFGNDFLNNSGINYKTISNIAFVFISVYVALVTSFVGIIAFLGLIAPHMARFFISNDTRFLLPGSFLFGWGVLTFSDILSKKMFYPSVLPVGILTSFSGVLVLIYLLFNDYDRS